MNRIQRRNLIELSFSAICFLLGAILNDTAGFLFAAAAWLIAGYRTIGAAVGGILRGELLDENFLMTVASFGAFCLGESVEGAAVMLFFRIGEQFETYAVNRSRKSIAALMSIRPDRAVIIRNGEEVSAEPEEVQIGDLILVKPGERVPVDGIITEGSASLDTSHVTGESQPLDAGEGDRILSGCINLSGVLMIRAESTYAHSTVGRILELVESASEKKAATERMITKFAQIYTPVVVSAAVLLALLPPLLFSQPFGEWIKRALTFLVISCPCALVISVPLSFFGGMGAASRHGIVIKGGIVLERLAKLQQIIFDKTGTLTSGEFSVSAIYPEGCSQDALLRLVAAAEQFSFHPAAKAICRSCETVAPAEMVEEIPGYGVSAIVDGIRVQAGNARMLERNGVSVSESSTAGSVVYVLLNDAYAGRIELSDTIRPDAAASVSCLRSLGIRKISMLTGDIPAAAKPVAEAIQLDSWTASLLPADKVNHLNQAVSSGVITAFVGDGVNDAPVLATADIGIAMGGVGSEAAVEASDVVILQDRLSALPEVVSIAKKTMKIAIQNIVFALGVKFLVLILGAFGMAGMWLAVFADVGVSVLAILNAMRTFTLKGQKSS